MLGHLQCQYLVQPGVQLLQIFEPTVHRTRRERGPREIGHYFPHSLTVSGGPGPRTETAPPHANPAIVPRLTQRRRRMKGGE